VGYLSNNRLYWLKQVVIQVHDMWFHCLLMLCLVWNHLCLLTELLSDEPLRCTFGFGSVSVHMVGKHGRTLGNNIEFLHIAFTLSLSVCVLLRSIKGDLSHLL